MNDAGYRFPDARLCVFAKAPVPGRVKTRLAAGIGARAAAAAYRVMLRERLAGLAAARLAPLELWVAPHPHPWLTALARRHGARLRVQPRGDLGARMGRALAGPAPTVIVGGDCPGLAVDTVVDALVTLAAGERLVFSPAEDGGYTLIGAGEVPVAALRRMPWGTGRVMAATRRRLRRAGLSHRELAPSWDVDEPADWRRWRRARAGFGRSGDGQYS